MHRAPMACRSSGSVSPLPGTGTASANCAIVWREELIWLGAFYGVVLGLLLLRQVPGAMNRA